MKEVKLLEEFGGDWPKKGGTRVLPDGQADYLVLTGRAELVERSESETGGNTPPGPTQPGGTGNTEESN